RLHVAGRDRPPLRHEEGDERELPDQLVRVMRHPRRTLPRGACGTQLWKPVERAALRRCLGFQVLVRGAVVALGERRPLARLAFPGGRPAAGYAAVEQPRLDLLLDELDRGL